jgi:hypothetical protein
LLTPPNCGHETREILRRSPHLAIAVIRPAETAGSWLNVEQIVVFLKQSGSGISGKMERKERSDE